LPFVSQSQEMQEKPVLFNTQHKSLMLGTTAKVLAIEVEVFDASAGDQG